jgi:hypothetical protein
MKAVIKSPVFKLAVVRSEILLVGVWTLKYFISFYNVGPFAMVVLGMIIPHNGMRDVQTAYLLVNSQCFKVQWFCFQPKHCIYVFCVDLRTNSDYFPIQL